MSDEFIRPDSADAIRLLREVQADCCSLSNFILGVAEHAGEAWRHHLPAMLSALRLLHSRCERELQLVGEWREDYRQMDEIANKLIDEEIKLCAWLSRVVGRPAPLCQ